MDVRSRADDVLSLREQSKLHDAWLDERLTMVLPPIMERAGVDCWVLIAREYNEDPVIKTMLPSDWEGARRRTILVFTDYGRNRIAISRYPVGRSFPAGWEPETEPDQWHQLAAYLGRQDPHTIGINRSPTFALADGMTATETELFLTRLPSHLADRVVSAETVALGWLETRSSGELEKYPEVCHRAHGLLRCALSPSVITPGKTTTADVEWWLRQTSQQHGYRTWFHPHVSVQRWGPEVTETIEPGDLVHIDFGIEYLGLHTDQQQHAYVLRPEESAPPPGLVAGLVAANRLQDLVMAEFRVGVTGNAILEAARSHAVREGLRPSVYSHPIGLHGHGAGPTIGLWDQQTCVPGAGAYPIHPHTAYSIELAATLSVPEWDGKDVAFMLEEDAYFDGETIDFLDGRQTELWLI